MQVTAVVGLVEHKDTILIGKKQVTNNHPISGQWHIPGGKVNPNETPQEALKREIYEETSIHVTNLQELETTKNDKHTIQWYTCTATNTNAQPADDLVEARFVKRTEVKNYCSNEAIKRWPKKIHAYLTTPSSKKTYNQL